LEEWSCSAAAVLDRSWPSAVAPASAVIASAAELVLRNFRRENASKTTSYFLAFIFV
jgi:hypothetical protein